MAPLSAKARDSPWEAVMGSEMAPSLVISMAAAKAGARAFVLVGKTVAASELVSVAGLAELLEVATG